MDKMFKDRKEQRKVTETMNSLLLPLLPYLNSDTAIIVKRALYLLGEIEIEPQEKKSDMYESANREIENFIKWCKGKYGLDDETGEMYESDYGDTWSIASVIAEYRAESEE